MSRLAAVKILIQLLAEKKSLSELKTQFTQLSPQDKPLVQELCYGVARWYFQLDFIVHQFLKKPFKRKDFDIYALLLIGIYQLQRTRIPDHAAINETVNAARLCGKEWATKIINAVLRNFVKNKARIMDKVSQNEVAFYSHPAWLIAAIKENYPCYQSILDSNNQYPPLCLRVNQLKISRADYLSILREKGIEATLLPYASQGIQLSSAINTAHIPFFEQGYVSVQDGSAQLAAEILAADKDETILDACAAPGGKAGHILEQQPNLKKLIAIDNEEARLQKVENNLRRLGLSAYTLCHDVTNLDWWQGNFFDRILLDVPCSALGVIRRHPDIKILRQATDIASLNKVQYQILETIWQTLKVGGTLLYVTCSILAAENEQIVAKFLHAHTNAMEEKIEAAWGLEKPVGRQIIPGLHEGMDGFYFAKIKKIS